MTNYILLLRSGKWDGQNRISSYGFNNKVKKLWLNFLSIWPFSSMFSKLLQSITSSHSTSLSVLFSYGSSREKKWTDDIILTETIMTKDKREQQQVVPMEFHRAQQLFSEHQTTSPLGIVNLPVDNQSNWNKYGICFIPQSHFAPVAFQVCFHTDTKKETGIWIWDWGGCQFI